MHVVVIHGWQEETAELTQTLASALGILVFEARQRIIGGGPAVVASFADPLRARALAEKLNHSGIATLVVDAAAVRGKAGHFMVHRFELAERSLRMEADDGQCAGIPYGEVDLVLAGTRIAGHSETVTVTERKFNLVGTILSGGIPLSKKVERQEEVKTEERENILFLHVGNQPPYLFRQNSMVYDGLGAAMKLSRELNFAYLTSELRRLSPGAVYDDRLLKRAGQVRLLGSALNPETNLDLAAEILARSLKRG